MIDTKTAVTALSSAVSILLLLVGWFKLHHDYFEDAFRQSMFGLRDELFDMGVQGELPFDHQAYTLLRTTMNGFIRFAHHLSLFQIFLCAIFRKGVPHRPSFAEQWETALRGCAPGTRAKLEGMRSRMNLLVAVHMFRVSPLALLLLAAILPSSLLGVLVGWCLARLKVSFRARVTNAVDSTAMVFGSTGDFACANG
jgi:hypothetical protein